MNETMNGWKIIPMVPANASAVNSCTVSCHGIKWIASVSWTFLFFMSVFLPLIPGHAWAESNPMLAPQQTQIVVDTSSDLGELPATFRAGMWMGSSDIIASDFYIYDKFFRENLPGAMQISPLLSKNEGIISTASFKEYKQRLIRETSPDTPYGKMILAVKRANAPFLYGFPSGFLPRWLSRYDYSPAGNPVCRGQPTVQGPGGIPSCDSWSIPLIGAYASWLGASSLPRDWALWRQVVQFTVKYFHTDEFADPDLGSIRGLGIKNFHFWFGHEPDWVWFGTEDEFFEFYARTAQAIKEIDPRIKVGGIGVSWFDRVRGCPYHDNLKELCKTHGSKNGQPMMKNFIEFAGKHKVPIDFLNYHQFGESPSELMRTRQNARKWLSQNGFDPDKVLLYPADWSLNGEACDPNQNRKHDQLDTEYRSAYAIATLYHMDKAGIKWHSHDFDVFDWDNASKVSQERRGSVFVGCWPNFTVMKNSQIIKPVYNAFRAVSILSGVREGQIPKRLKTQFDENRLLTAVSSQTKDRRVTRILISNFISETTGPVALQTLNSCVRAKGYSDSDYTLILDSLKRVTQRNPPPQSGLTREYLDQAVSQAQFPSPLDAGKVRGDVQSCLPDMVASVRVLQAYSQGQRKVDLTLLNLRQGHYILRKYLIDKHHSNACHYNKRTEPTPSAAPCGIGGDIDRKINEVTQGPLSGGRLALEYLGKKGYTDQQLNTLKEAVQSCSGNVQCVKEKVDTACSRIVGPGKKCALDRIMTDFKEAIRTGKESHEQSLHKAIEAVNSQKGVALEVVEERRVTVEGSEHREVLMMEPNSVLLLELAM